MILKDYDFGAYTIQDPIHGSITFGEVERKLIDHRHFQRLHGLRQNSLLYLIFPAANHTRFDHSIGVMSLAHKFLSSIIQNQERIIDKGRKRKSWQKEYRVDGSNIEKTFKLLSKDQYYFLVLRVASLFHDIGHGPFSHLFDKFFPDGNFFLKILKNESKFKHIFEVLDKIEKNKLGEVVRHEFLSCIIVTQVLSDNSKVLKKYKINTNKMIRDVCSIIEPKIRASNQLERFDYKVQKLFADILSSDIDVDRMDFLLRDSHMCGVSYGLYEPNRILKSMCAYGIVKSKELRVGIRFSSLGAFEDFLHSRYQMYKQIYGHKTNRSCNAMLEAIRKRLLKEKWSWFDRCKNIDDLMTKFRDFDDNKFVQTLLSNESSQNYSDTKEIGEKLFLERKLIKKVFEDIAQEGDHKTLEIIRQRYIESQKRLKKKGLWFTPDIYQNKGPKFQSVGYPLKVLKKTSLGFYIVKDILSCSPFVNNLPQVELTFRIYCKNKNRDKAKQLIRDLN